MQFSFEVLKQRLWLLTGELRAFISLTNAKRNLSSARIICYLKICRLQKRSPIIKKKRMNSGNIVVGPLVVHSKMWGTHMMSFWLFGTTKLVPMSEWNLGSQNELQDAPKQKDFPPPICTPEAMLRLTEKAGEWLCMRGQDTVCCFSFSWSTPDAAVFMNVSWM